jgi:hypothetical protein
MRVTFKNSVNSAVGLFQIIVGGQMTTQAKPNATLECPCRAERRDAKLN